MKKIEFKKVLITPELAESYLTGNIKNRRAIDNRIKTYSKDMIEGRWKEDTAEFIKISKSGILLDGQNRLLAIIDSKASINMWVCFNMDDEIFDVLDTGKPRSAGDVFKISAIKYETTLPSIISFYKILKTVSIGMAQNRLTNTEIRDIYYENENLWQDIARHSHMMYEGFSKILSTRILGGFYAIFLEIDEIKANNFMNELTTGKNVSNNVIILLRNRLIQEKMASKKTKETFKYIFIIKAWNCYFNNIEPKVLKFNYEYDNIPKIDGLITNKVNNKLGLVYHDNKL